MGQVLLATLFLIASFPTDIGEIRILSEMRKSRMICATSIKRRCLRFPGRSSFYIGDVRDYNSIVSAFRGVDYVFHAAALKQVPSCEFYPMEAVNKTTG